MKGMLALVIFMSCVMLVPIAGCDTGFCFYPVDAQGKISKLRSETIDGVRFEQEHFFDLMGTDIAIVELSVFNSATVDVVVVGATVTSKGRALKGTIVGRNGIWAIPHGASDTVVARWDFSLGEMKTFFDEPGIVWTWNVRIGEKERSVVVNMQRR